MVEVDSAFGSLHIIDVGSVVDVSEVHAITIFRVEVSRMSEFSCIYRFFFAPCGFERCFRRFCYTWWALQRLHLVTIACPLSILAGVGISPYPSPVVYWPKTDTHINTLTSTVHKNAGNRRFGGTYRLHLQGRRNNFSKNQQVSKWQAEFSASRKTGYR
jgi:hypothetical protein